MEKLFLANDSLLRDLLNILDNILRFCKVLEQLYTSITEEGRRRAAALKKKYSRKKGLADDGDLILR